MIGLTTKMLRASAGAGGSAEPFSLSGSWENQQDGWTVKPGRTLTYYYPARTGGYAPYYVYGDEDLTYTLPAEQVNGLRITCSVWHAFDYYTSLDMDVRIVGVLGSDPEVVLTAPETSGATYKRLTGSVEPASGQSVKFILKGQGTVYFDDWTITGVRK